MTETCPPSRREARRQDRRSAILAVAKSYFLDHGYAGTTMSAIAAELGGSKATLWSYFPSKEELFAAAIEAASTDRRSRLAALLDPNDSLETVLRRFCLAMLRMLVEPDAIRLHRLVVAESGRFPEMGSIYYERAPTGTWNLLSRFFGHAMERGVLERCDPSEAARTLTSLTMSGCHQQVLLGVRQEATPEAIEADVERAVRLFFRAFGRVGDGARTAAAA